MPVLPRGRGSRPTVQKTAAPKPAPAPQQESRSLVSDSKLNTPEPTELRGSTESGYSSTTSGRHHGTLLALADAVGHHAASLTEGGISSSHQKGLASLEKVYDHLSAHSQAHNSRNHEESAGHLNEAAKHLNQAVTDLGSTRGVIKNAYGEQIQGRDIKATTQHLVNHYATAHNTKIGQVSTPAQYRGVPTKKAEERLEQKKTREKYQSPRGRAPLTKSEGGESSSGLPKLAPLSKMSPNSAVDMDKMRLPTMKETVVAAVNHYRKHGEMHPDHLRALPEKYHTDIPKFVEQEKRAANEF